MKKVLEIAYHRNGVSGEGFHIVRFSSEDDVLIGVVFPKEHHVAVFNEGLLGQGVIEAITLNGGLGMRSQRVSPDCL